MADQAASGKAVEQVKEKPTEEVKEETKEEVKEKPKEEVKEEPKEEVKEQTKEEVENKENVKKTDRKEGEGACSTPASSGAPTPEPNSQENGEDAPAVTLREQFRNYSKFGDIKSDGKMLTLSQSDKWFKQAKVIDGKKLTTTDTAITFNKYKTKKISFKDFEKYLDDIAKNKKLDVNEVKTKLKECGAPGVTGTTSVAKSTALDRLTDTKKFTGSHKLRFDATGRGKGISGRKDDTDTSGYVKGYKNKNTYDTTH